MAVTIGISERLSRLIDSLGLTTYQFSKALGYDRPEKIYAVVNGKTKPSFDTLSAITDTFKQVNPKWLLNGEGDMFFPEPNARIVSAPQDKNYTDYPFVPIRFQATFVEGYSATCRLDNMETYRVYSADGRTYKNAAVFEVEGNSMWPQIRHGARVLAVCVDKGDWCYQSGGVYAVMYKDYFVIKRIKDNELLTRKLLTLHSDNPEGGSMPVPLEEIRGIWKVVKVVDAPVE
ncbi:MAG: LexA family transcriptional regulator [Cytophagales bacterium]|nr:LexA family transcriptional regulator [Cytophagales bacterium]